MKKILVVALLALACNETGPAEGFQAFQERVCVGDVKGARDRIDMVRMREHIRNVAASRMAGTLAEGRIDALVDETAKEYAEFLTQGETSPWCLMTDVRRLSETTVQIATASGLQRTVTLERRGDLWVIVGYAEPTK